MKTLRMFEAATDVPPAESDSGPRPGRISYDVLALKPGTRLGAFEIVAPLGAGGMG